MKNFLSFFFKSISNKQKDKLREEFENEKQRYIAELEKKDISFLLNNIDSSAYFSNLVVKKQRVLRSYGSEDNISYYIRDQIRNLKNLEFKNELISFLTQKEYSDKKDDIYWCLSSLCGNTNNKEIYYFLMKKLDVEVNYKAQILQGLWKFHKTIDYDINPIKNIVINGKYYERLAAIEALNNSDHTEIHNFLLEEFKNSGDDFMLKILGVIWKTSTKETIPILEKGKRKSRNRYLRMQIEELIDNIKSRK